MTHASGYQQSLTAAVAHETFRNLLQAADSATRTATVRTA